MADGVRHPHYAGKPPSDAPAYPYAMDVPIMGTTKPMVTFNEVTVVNTAHAPGHHRVVLGLSRHDLRSGTALAMDEAETESLIGLLQNGLEDLRRMKAGKVPLARLHDPSQPDRQH
jgi:hypothetical protein